jgi:hypothetical protein
MSGGPRRGPAHHALVRCDGDPPTARPVEGGPDREQADRVPTLAMITQRAARPRTGELGPEQAHHAPTPTSPAALAGPSTERDR